MEIAAIVRWGKPDLERYELGYESLKASFAVLEALKREGKITSYEVLGLETGDRARETAFLIIKGPEQSIRLLPQEPRLVEAISKGVFLNAHFKMDFAVTTEEFIKRAELGRKVAQELVLVPVH